MKRMLIVVIAVFLATSLPGWAGKEAAARDKEFIRIAGGSTGATFHIMASGICTLLNANVSWIDATPEPGGSVMNARRIGTQKLIMGLLTSNPYLPKTHDKVRKRLSALLEPTPWQPRTYLIWNPFYSADHSGCTSGTFCFVGTSCLRVRAYDRLHRCAYWSTPRVLPTLDTRRHTVCTNLKG